MKTYKWGEVRKEAGCHDRGHRFQRDLGYSGRSPDDLGYKCRCGARAIANREGLAIIRRKW